MENEQHVQVNAIQWTATHTLEELKLKLRVRECAGDLDRWIPPSNQSINLIRERETEEEENERIRTLKLEKQFTSMAARRVSSLLSRSFSASSPFLFRSQGNITHTTTPLP